MLLAALLVWQLLLVAWTFNQASNAARTASRVDGRGGSGEKAGRAALSPGLREHAEVRDARGAGDGAGADPDRHPGPGRSDSVRATRSAELPG